MRGTGWRLLRRQCQEPVQLGFEIAGAGMRRDVKETVTRQHAELARASNPVVGDALTRCQVDQFHTRSAEEEVTIRGPVAVAPVVSHADLVELLIHRAPSLDFASQRIAPHGNAGVVCCGDFSGPDQAVGPEHVYRCVEPLSTRAGLQSLAGLGGQRDQFTDG